MSKSDKAKTFLLYGHDKKITSLYAVDYSLTTQDSTRMRNGM